MSKVHLRKLKLANANKIAFFVSYADNKSVKMIFLKIISSHKGATTKVRILIRVLSASGYLPLDMQ